MQEVTREQVVKSLKSVGITRGDSLLVHSAVQFLGRPKDGVGIYLQAIMEVIGPQGTLAVPTFNFGFAQGERYDPENTPSKGMGVFSEYVLTQPNAHRTSHPMQSLAVIGFHANDLVNRNTPSAFERGSAFERIVDLDFKLLLLGADISASSIFHYSETCNNVPYRYWKDFSGEYKTPNGWQNRTYRMFVRDLDLNPVLTAQPVEDLLIERSQWRTVKINYGVIVACSVRDFIAAVDHFLNDDPWSLVTNRPLNL